MCTRSIHGGHPSTITFAKNRRKTQCLCHQNPPLTRQPKGTLVSGAFSVPSVSLGLTTRHVWPCGRGGHDQRWSASHTVIRVCSRPRGEGRGGTQAHPVVHGGTGTGWPCAASPSHYVPCEGPDAHPSCPQAGPHIQTPGILPSVSSRGAADSCFAFGCPNRPTPTSQSWRPHPNQHRLVLSPILRGLVMGSGAQWSWRAVVDAVPPQGPRRRGPVRFFAAPPKPTVARVWPLSHTVTPSSSGPL